MQDGKINLSSLHEKLMKVGHEFDVPDKLPESTFDSYLRGYSDSIEYMIKLIREEMKNDNLEY